MGEISGCLRICITHNQTLHTIQLDQEAYFSFVLSNYGLENCTPIATLCDEYTAILPVIPDEEQTNQQLYSSMAGSLTWGVVIIRLDISWINGRLSQFCIDSTI